MSGRYDGIDWHARAGALSPNGAALAKQSGTGRDKSLHAFDKYTELKTPWIDLS
jgi:acyl-CoA reductase-like NAD-dependent aldehyde dehydrogenase